MTAPPRGRLATYRAKRDFARTAEPAGGGRRGGKALAYVVQRHDATRLHYDLRLEWDGAMKSWAVTRGPSLDPADKRLAVEVEDHPIAYNEFEGTIPKGQYGGGTVQIWDRGVWTPADPARVAEDLAAGKLKFTLHGERLTGAFTLVRMRPRKADRGRNNWLLIKEHDAAARPGEGDTALEAATSIVTGRTLAQIAAEEAPGGEAPAAAPAAAKRAPARRAKGGPMPDFVPPMLCKPLDAPPGGAGWLHEIKLDGYRLQLRVEGGTARLRTRTGLDWSDRFPVLIAAAAGLPDCLIDGEAVVLDADGIPDFAALQAMLAGESKAEPVFFGFDLLFAGGQDHCARTLEQRKAALAEILPGTQEGRLRFLSHFDAPGEAVLRSACRMDLEGIVSKRAGSAYRSGRSGDWTKAKCRGREEFVVGGWEADRTGKGIGSLLVGTWRDGKLIYVGRVGTGYGEPARKLLLPKLGALARKTSPFDGRQPDRRPSASRWTEPRLLVEVAYGGWTGQGILRHASYLGVREDKPAQEEAEMAPAKTSSRPRTGRAVVAGIALSTPERVLWPAASGSPEVTKHDLARYVEEYADRLLPHLAHRPVSILRAPDGIGGQTFFQRHAMKGMSSLIRQIDVEDDTHKPYIYIEDVGGLAALVQMNVVEFHPWGATVDALDTPDRLIFDLDPDEGLDFARVIEATAELKQRLEDVGLVPFLKSTGGKGLHVAVPLDARAGGAVKWPDAKTFARTVCAMMAQDAPDRFTVTLAKKARGGRIFLDYLRNDRTSTAVSAWSPRGRPGAPVAVPLPWTALRRDLKPGGEKLAALLAAKKAADPWKDFAKAGVPLAKAIRALTSATPARRGRRSSP